MTNEEQLRKELERQEEASKALTKELERLAREGK
ncbi:hypothetical protein P405_17220 [Streptomyces sp. FR-008]|nr:hypothetical protein SFR_6947 [Streptomyces sp. FR-008]KAF0794851.1 hypothetical protein P405_17220 [Streptomyces sp. FR-008]